jgi:hypothetical protein
MLSCFSVIFATVSAIFIGGTMPRIFCSDFPCVLQTPSPSVFLTPTSSASASASASMSASASVSASASTNSTPTAIPTVSYEYSYHPDVFDPESVCENRDAFVKYIPCTNTEVMTKNNMYEHIILDSDVMLESDTWQIPGEKNEFTHISYVGIPLQAIFSSVRISMKMNCTTRDAYTNDRNEWTIHTAPPFTVEYSELPTYENIWFKLHHPAVVQKTDICQVHVHLSGKAEVYFQADHLGVSFAFGLIA